MGGSVTGASDIWHLYYTSGTTGRPKGVALSHRAMCTHAFGTVGEFNYTAADVWGHFAPMYHVADAFAIVAITIVGGSHVLQERIHDGEKGKKYQTYVEQNQIHPDEEPRSRTFRLVKVYENCGAHKCERREDVARIGDRKDYGIAMWPKIVEAAPA